MGLFKKYHNTFCCPSKVLQKHCFVSAAEIILCLSFIKQEPAALQENYFLLSLRTHVHCFTGNVNTYSWFVKANIHLKNSFMVWLIQKQKIEQLPLSNFVLTDGDGSYCKWGVHSLFASWRLHLRRCSMHVRTAIDGMSVVALNLWRQDSFPWPDISVNITPFVKPKSWKKVLALT